MGHTLPTTGCKKVAATLGSGLCISFFLHWLGTQGLEFREEEGRARFPAWAPPYPQPQRFLVMTVCVFVFSGRSLCSLETEDGIKL